MIRMAVLSDIHGNSLALEAVLADLDDRGGADYLVVLGDLAVFGPDPVGVLNLLREYDAIYVRGNTDRYLVEGKYPPRPNAPGWQAQLIASFPWTLRQLSPADLEFLAGMPASQLLRLSRKHSVMAVHGSPRSDEEKIHPYSRDCELRCMLLGGLFYNLLLCGHAHAPLDRAVDQWRVVNAGSVGMPLNGDTRACYSLIDLKPGGEYRVQFPRVKYEVEAVVAQLEAVEHPAAMIQSYNLRMARTLNWRQIYIEAGRQTPVLSSVPCPAG